jgi:hypothetical protein
LLLSEQSYRTKQMQQPASTAAPLLANAEISVDRRFAQSSRLQYLIFIYNASRGKNGQAQPEVTLQTQVFRGREIVLESPARQISASGQDLARIPYAAEIPLSGMPAGRYELLVKVYDRLAKTNREQRIGFEISGKLEN